MIFIDSTKLLYPHPSRLKAKESLIISFIVEQLFASNIDIDTKWIQNGITVAGRNGNGNGLNQLARPSDVYVDDDQTIYVADQSNHRIVEWKKGATVGRIVAGGNGEGNRNDQLKNPRNVMVDKVNDSLIICDGGNKRVVQWPRRSCSRGETIISNIDCWGLAMDNDGYLYVSDISKHEVRRWIIGETSGTLVAGGYGQGNHLNQFSEPRYIFVDQSGSVYVSDCFNDRVMKWMKGAKEGIVVAGGQGQENDLTQLYYPHGIIVDQLGTLYVSDFANHRVVRWSKGANEGSVVVGGNGKGKQVNQFYYLNSLSFDEQYNLYVVDYYNHRVQKFLIDSR
jgi:sugar lactone lactonase YvrE